MKNKILQGLTIVFGLIMINAGLNKFFNYMPMPELSNEMIAVFTALVTIKWILPLVAVVEILAGILIMIPRFRALASLMLAPIMVGIVVHHLVHDVAGLGLPLALLFIIGWVIWDSRSKYLPLVN
jgi:uncharacterized membrane protein YphA (DoxX/SURF4 family)